MLLLARLDPRRSPQNPKQKPPAAARAFPTTPGRRSLPDEGEEDVEDDGDIDKWTSLASWLGPFEAHVLEPKAIVTTRQPNTVARDRRLAPQSFRRGRCIQST